jgi:ferredoxin-NADP reductase
MPTYRVRLKAQRELAASTLGFYFEKPSEFAYRGGQFVNLTLVDPPETDAEGNTRAFTLSSAPHENNLMVATRMRDSAFKRALSRLAPGTELKLAGPYGNFILSTETSRPAVLLAGGIGVTPFRSMALEAIHRGSARLIFLFYSNRRPEDAAFLEELTQTGEANPNFRFVPLMTQIEKSNRVWNGPTGRLGVAGLQRRLGSLDGAEYYLAGPPGFVVALGAELSAAGIPAQDIRVDEFDGYN